MFRLCAGAILLLACVPEPPVPSRRPLPDIPRGSVSWQSWEQRDTDASPDRSLLLFLSTRRSYWCWDMAVRCFQDSTVAAEIDRVTIPIWADIDRRPDLAERFGMGAWPSIAFLFPDGSWITGSTYTDADDVMRLLRRLDITFTVPDRMVDLQRAKRRLTTRLARRRRTDAPQSIQLGPALSDTLAMRIAQAIPSESPVSVETIVFQLEYGRLRPDPVAETSALSRLNREADRARVDGGLYANRRLTADGRLLDSEVHLARQAELLKAMAYAARLSGDAALGQRAVDLGDALLARMYDPELGVFWSGYAGFTLDPSVRPHLTSSAATGGAPVDTLAITSWNGLSASAFAELARLTRDDRYRRVAEGILRAMNRRRTEDGLFTRTDDPGGPRFLEDQAAVLRAAVDLQSVRNDAIVAAVDTIRHLFGAVGPLRDRHPEPGNDVAPALDRIVPSANGVMAQVVLRAGGARTAAQTAQVESILRALIPPNLSGAGHLGALGRALLGHLYPVRWAALQEGGSQ